MKVQSLVRATENNTLNQKIKKKLIYPKIKPFVENIAITSFKTLIYYRTTRGLGLLHGYYSHVGGITIYHKTFKVIGVVRQVINAAQLEGCRSESVVVSEDLDKVTGLFC
jgi:hypothetical protein